MTYDLLNHSDVSGEYLMPDDDGGTKTTTVTIRQVVGVITNGTLQAEAWAEGTADLVVDHNGVVVEVGGEASLEVIA